MPSDSWLAAREARLRKRAKLPAEGPRPSKPTLPSHASGRIHKPAKSLFGDQGDAAGEQLFGTVAALFVAEDGPYIDRHGVDAWTRARDALLYDGEDPAVVHSPCERFGRYAEGGPNPKAARRKIGDDGGCFAHGLKIVRRNGGVMEHPAGSKAWAIYGLPRPPSRGWSEPDAHGGRSCRVDQGRYGHPAKKATWLYAVLPDYPELDWEPAQGLKRLELGPRSKEHAKAIRAAPGYVPPKRLSKAERIHTPPAFADLLLGMAATCNVEGGP